MEYNGKENVILAAIKVITLSLFLEEKEDEKEQKSEDNDKDEKQQQRKLNSSGSHTKLCLNSNRLFHFSSVLFFHPSPLFHVYSTFINGKDYSAFFLASSVQHTALSISLATSTVIV